MRVLLYITASVTVSSDPQTLPVVTGVLVRGLFLLNRAIGLKVYRKSLVDILDTLFYFNLIALAFCSLYDFKTNIVKQTAVAYTSTFIAFVLLVGVTLYHVALLIKKDKPAMKLDEYLLPPL